MLKLYEIFYILQIQKRIVFAETVCRNTVSIRNKHEFETLPCRMRIVKNNQTGKIIIMIYRLYFRNFFTPLFSRRWDNTGSQKSIRVNVDVTSLPIYKSRHGLQRVLLYFSCISVSAWISWKSLENYTQEITTEFFWASQIQSFMYFL